MPENIYSQIKSIREIKNYTQEYMAHELDISQAAYHKIESGKTQLTYGKLQRIAEIFKVGVDGIMGFDLDAYIENLTLPKDKNHRETSSGLHQNAPNGNEIYRLYEDKIALLERLLLKTEKELEYYKKKHMEILLFERTAITYT